MTNNKPADTLRDGAIKATIWKNPTDNGSFYSVTFGRTYTDDQGTAKSTDNFSNGEVLRLAHLATKAYDRIAELRQQDKA